MIKFSIIIVNYKQENLLKNCISSIYNTFKSSTFEVIIINNSPENKLASFNLPNIKIIETKNYGYANANNIGVKNASGKYLFFLNADTIIKNDFLSDFEKEFSEKEFGAVGLELCYTDGGFQPSCYLENNFLNEIKNKKLEIIFKKKNAVKKSEIEKKYSTIRKVDWVSGAGMIVKKDIFKKIGGFDERFFLFYEDADICKRLKNEGFCIYYFPFSKIIHLKGENVNAEFNNITYYFSKKSQLLYYKLHNSFIQNLLIRTYLIVKFSALRIINPSRMNILVFKLLFGKKND
jgi:GT2 family glycosyltransferase